MTTTRLPSSERAHFRTHWPEYGKYGQRLRNTEPALGGTLDQRLDIILRRHGGRAFPLPLRAPEREAYQAWLSGDTDALPDSLGGSYNRPIGQESRVA